MITSRNLDVYTRFVYPATHSKVLSRLSKDRVQLMNMPTASKGPLFLCNKNAGRSQMAEMIYKRMYNRPALSAGSSPTTDGQIHTNVEEYMQSIGYDTTHVYSKPLLPEHLYACDLIVACCGPDCSPNVADICWSVEDPGCHQDVDTIYRHLVSLISSLHPGATKVDIPGGTKLVQ